MAVRKHSQCEPNVMCNAINQLNPPPVSKPLDAATQSHRDRQHEALLEFRNRRLQRRLDDLEVSLRSANHLVYLLAW